MEAEDRKDGKNSFSHKHKEEMQVIFHKPKDLLIYNIIIM